MKIEYRPEIDGLRAISVIAVILYHLEIFTNNTNLFKGGFVGVVAYTQFMPNGDDSTVNDVIDGFEHVINVVGEDQVGIGTDFTQDQDTSFFHYLRSDKGIGRALSKPMTKRPDNPIGFDGPAEYVNLTAAMIKRGWNEKLIQKLLGENWLAFLEEVWGG